MKKLRVKIGEEEGVLQLEGDRANVSYHLNGWIQAKGMASIVTIQEGVFSVLLDSRSYTVHVLPASGGLEVWVGNERFTVEMADLRDRASNTKKPSLAGPYELRALMPGKVVKLLVAPGAKVETGQSLIVVEAMKMQNEIKSPKDGVVKKIYASEGATVLAGEGLMVVE